MRLCSTAAQRNIAGAESYCTAVPLVAALRDAESIAAVRLSKSSGNMCE